ncbi:MAG: carbohydrate kinase [Pedobacter sp.]|nr:MAG: carbohydrate kinase [Pedobacter sp.]
MSATPVIAVFDIGKTNKKLLLFNEDYDVVLEESASFEETTDEEGFPCEDVDVLTSWILRHVQLLGQSKTFDVKAINFSTYGASLVYIDANGKRLAPLYNYLKTYPDDVLKRFHQAHGDKERIAVETSSPVMGHLNAGLQLYWFKHQRPELFSQLHAVLHFPQYLSYQLTGRLVAEMTNVGCHSAMWNFHNRTYHDWLRKEEIDTRLMPVVHGNQAVKISNAENADVAVGVGLHDSSAAIIPYLLSFSEPFVIVSTGTWTITLNPFNNELPAAHDLNNGCLSYLTYDGNPVKVSMLFSGHDHQQQLDRIAAYFNVETQYLQSLAYNHEWRQTLKVDADADEIISNTYRALTPTDPCVFHLRELSRYQSPAQAYHQLIIDLIGRQKDAINAVMSGGNIQNMYVDGGFCKNSIYMQVLSDAFPHINVFASSMKQGTALGAALAIHNEWNQKKLPDTLIRLKPWHKTDSGDHTTER